MGTFHQDRGGLHGITVVVETIGPELYVGRCDHLDAGRIVLNDVDVHREGVDTISRQEYLELAARLGTWKKYDRLVLSCQEVTAVKRLAEF